ncbi:MAG: acyl carrier protein [Pirellulales bacterium]
MPVNTNLPHQSVPTRESVLEDVKRIVAEFASIPAEQIQETHDLIGDLGCDSLDMVEITMEVEEHFDVSVPDDVAQDIHTVGDIVDGVLRLLGQGNG